MNHFNNLTKNTLLKDLRVPLKKKNFVKKELFLIKNKVSETCADRLILKKLINLLLKKKDPAVFIFIKKSLNTQTFLFKNTTNLNNVTL
jgi:hypothetical protein